MIDVPYVRTVDNIADFFTKPLPAKVFYAMRDAIMNIPAPAAYPCGACGGTGVVKGEPCYVCSDDSMNATASARSSPDSVSGGALARGSDASSA